MSQSSTKAKRKYNNENYDAIHVHIDKNTVRRFKEFVRRNEISQADTIRYLITTLMEYPDVNWRSYLEDREEQAKKKR